MITPQNKWSEVHTSAYLYTRVPTCTQEGLPVHTSAYLYKRVPTCDVADEDCWHISTH